MNIDVMNWMDVITVELYLATGSDYYCTPDEKSLITLYKMGRVRFPTESEAALARRDRTIAQGQGYNKSIKSCLIYLTTRNSSLYNIKEEDLADIRSNDVITLLDSHDHDPFDNRDANYDIVGYDEGYLDCLSMIRMCDKAELFQKIKNLLR
jgi:hypothetical protein